MTQLEKVGAAVHQGGRRAHLIEQFADEFPPLRHGSEVDRPVQQRVRSDFPPELAQLANALARRIASYQRRIDRSDRDASDPVGM